MDYDFLNKDFLGSAQSVIGDFRKAVEDSSPPPKELDSLVEQIRPYKHATALAEDFKVCGIDGSRAMGD